MIAQPLFKRPAAAASTAGYQRPSDWLPLTDMSSTEGFSGLHAVWNNDSNFCALRCAGAYTVDWGDGSAPENIASNTIAYHKFNWADCDPSTLTSRGYRQAVVTVTPQSGSSLTNISINIKHNQAGLISNYATGWLDVVINAPNLTSLGVSGGNVRHWMLEKFKSISLGSLTSGSGMFNSCSLLQSVEIDTSLFVNMYQMFNSCYALQYLNIDCSSNTTFYQTFTSCFALQNVSLGNTNNVDGFQSAFQNCNALQGITLDCSSSTGFSGTFSSCTSLARVQATNISKTISFQNCKLSAAALDEIYTNLATVTGQTITVSGNYGTSGDNPSIATAKGWTVTG